MLIIVPSSVYFVLEQEQVMVCRTSEGGSYLLFHEDPVPGEDADQDEHEEHMARDLMLGQGAHCIEYFCCYFLIQVFGKC